MKKLVCRVDPPYHFNESYPTTIEWDVTNISTERADMRKRKIRFKQELITTIPSTCKYCDQEPVAYVSKLFDHDGGFVCSDHLDNYKTADYAIQNVYKHAVDILREYNA